MDSDRWGYHHFMSGRAIWTSDKIRRVAGGGSHSTRIDNPHWHFILLSAITPAY
jgi:hypothetical protein